MMDRRAFLSKNTLRRPRRSVAPPPSPDFPGPKPLAITAGLEPFTAALTTASASHLLRRTWYSAPAEQREMIIGQPANQAAVALVERAKQAPLPESPTWINNAEPPREASDSIKNAYNRNNRDWRNEWIETWINEMLSANLATTTGSDGLREKMTLFWHNHFVTELRDYKLATYAYRYVTRLQIHALGNFKDFVHAIGIEPAMLRYLNGNQNRKQAPNENYGRELLELFTMGEFDEQGNANYTQEDVQEVARALTGWVINRETIASEIAAERFDPGPKTIFGRTAAFNYDGLIDLLFEERGEQIARFICRKIYKEFVYAAPDEAIVAELADLFIDQDFEIAPVVETLLCSSHFFDTQVAGAQIKDPATYFVSFLRDLNATINPTILQRVRNSLGFMGQPLLDPPNVAGWQGHRAWLTSSTLPVRWIEVDRLMGYLRALDLIDLFQLVEAVHDSDNRRAIFVLPVALAQHFLGIQVEDLDILTPSDGFGGDLEQNPIPADIQNGPPHVLDLTNVFLAGTPWYEWDQYNPAAIPLIFNFILALKQAPDFQLT